MKNKVEVSKKISKKESFSNFENNPENEGKISDIAGESFSDLDSALDESLKENKEILEKNDDEDIVKICDQAEVEIKAIEEKSESKLMKLFDSIIDKADYKWNEIKNNRSYKKLYSDLADMGHELYGEKIDKYKKERDGGNAKKLNDYYLNFEKRLLNYLNKYHEIDKKYLHGRNAESLDLKLESQFDTLISHKIDNGKIEEALEIWSDCPNKIINRDAAPSLGKKIRKYILDEAGIKSSYDSADHKKEAEIIKKRLEAYPEIILLVLGEGGCYEKTDNRKDNEFLEPLKKVISDPDKHYSLSQINLSDDIFRKDLTPEIKEVVFKEYLKNNPGLINNNAAVFQEEIDKLEGGERKKYFDNNVKYSSELLRYSSCIKLNQDEFNYALGSIGYSNDDKSSLDNLILNVKGNNDSLPLLTNADNFGLDEAAQKEILENLENCGSSKVFEYAQLLAYPEKYPGLGLEVINKSFSNFLEKNNNSETLSKIFYNDIKISDNQKEEFIKTCFTDPWPSVALDFLNYNHQYLSPKDRGQIEKIVVEKISYINNLSLRDAKVLNEFSSDNLEAAIKLVKNIYCSDFFDLFINCQDGTPGLPIKYFGELVGKIDDYKAFGDYLNVSLNSGKISLERYDEIINETCASWSITKILGSKIAENKPEMKADIFSKFIESNDIEDLKKILELINNKELVLVDQDELKFCYNFLKIVDLKNLNLLYSSTYKGPFIKHFKLDESNNLVSLFLEVNNISVLSDFLERNISEKNLKIVVDKIISFGDSNSRLELLKSFPNYIRYINGNYSSSVGLEKIDELVEVMIDKGSPLELVTLLKYGYPSKTDRNLEKLSPEKSLIVKNKIFDSGDPEALDALFNIYFYDRDRLSLNDNEKDKLADILISRASLRSRSLFNLLKINKEFNLSEEKIESILENLSNNNQDQFIAAIEDNIYAPYFKIGKEKMEIIVDDFVSKHGEMAPEFFTMYVDSFRNINHKSEELVNILNNDQINLIVDKISKERNASGKFLVEYLELNENREKIAGKNNIDIFTLSDSQIDTLMSVYISDGNFSDSSRAEEIYAAYPEIFEEKFIQEIILKENTRPLLQIIESGSASIIGIVERKQDLIIQKLKNEVKLMDSDKRDNGSLISFYSTLNKLGLYKAEHFKDLDEILASNDNSRKSILDFSSIFSSIIKNKNIEVIDEVSGEKLSEKFIEFRKKYNISGKGETILNLVAANEYKKAFEKDDKTTIDLVLINIESALERYDRILSLHDPKEIPAGLQASIGMEYEVTSSIAGSYKEKTGNSYSGDANKLSANANIGKGNDAVHEFATKPTDNPYLMLLEMKLLQDLDFIDFNFKSGDKEGGYDRASSTYHLTIGGEYGLGLNRQTNFLQNMILAANLGGVYSGTEVSQIGKARCGCSIRNRGTSTNTIKVFDNLTSAVELRAISVDKWEQFERASLINYNAAIAIQAVDKYTRINNLEKFENISQSSLDNSNNFYIFLKENDILQEDIKDEKIKEIIYHWLKVQIKMTQAIKDHNENFIDNETYGYLDEQGVWVDAIESSRGRDNKTAFQEIIDASSPGDYLETYYEKKLKINKVEDFFGEISVDIANKLTRLNNLYLKGDQVNIKNMLNTTMENGFPDSNGIHDSEQSIFDLDGKTRKGKYYIQGASDKFLINQAQELLLNFVEEMQKTLKKTSSVNSSDEVMAA
ncbi:MAG: hypothetical protein ACOYL8_00670 [Patescibacteria group bacterium]